MVKNPSTSTDIQDTTCEEYTSMTPTIVVIDTLLYTLGRLIDSLETLENTLYEKELVN